MGILSRPHGKHVWKIRAHAISEQANWIQNWPGRRNKRVVTEGCFSDCRPVACGVLQDLVLGPLLFVI